MPTPSSPGPAQDNIAKIAAMEDHHERSLPLSNRISESIGTFAGTNYFVIVQLLLVAGWAAVNLNWVPWLPAFDPYPFTLLSVVLSLEGVLLTTFVLVKQNRMSLRTDRRSHLDLQVNLLAEKEATKVLQLLQRMGSHLGIEDEPDAETTELAKDTTVEGLAGELHSQFGTKE